MGGLRLRFRDKAAERSVDELMDATGCKSRAEVISDALDMYLVLVRKAAKGEHVYVGADRKTASEVSMLPVDIARMKGNKDKGGPRSR